MVKKHMIEYLLKIKKYQSSVKYSKFLSYVKKIIKECFNKKELKIKKICIAFCKYNKIYLLLSSGRTKRSEEHTSELQSHSFISYAVFCLKKKNY